MRNYKRYYKFYGIIIINYLTHQVLRGCTSDEGLLFDDLGGHQAMFGPLDAQVFRRLCEHYFAATRLHLLQ